MFDSILWCFLALILPTFLFRRELWAASLHVVVLVVMSTRNRETCDSLLTIFANWMKVSGTDCLTDLSQNEIGRNYQYRLTVDYILHIMYWSYDLLGQVTGSQFKPSCSHWNLRSIKVSSVAPSQFQIWREAKASQYILKYYNIILGETWGNDCRMFMVRIKYCSKGCVPN